MYYVLPFFSAAPATSSNAEMDLFGSLSDSFPSNSLAIVPTTSATTTSEADAYSHAAPATTFVAAASAADVVNQVGTLCYNYMV